MKTIRFLIEVEADDQEPEELALAGLRRLLAERILRYNHRVVLMPSTNLEDVLDFHNKFGVPMAGAPSFLNDEAFEFRRRFMQEELDEFSADHLAGNMHGAADALVDLAYVVLGTALMMGLPWQQLWDEVQRANMAKVRATDAGQSKRGTALDVVKPAGWTPPDHHSALGAGPWPTLVA